MGRSRIFCVRLNFVKSKNANFEQTIGSVWNPGQVEMEIGKFFIVQIFESLPKATALRDNCFDLTNLTK